MPASPQRAPRHLHALYVHALGRPQRTALAACPMRARQGPEGACPAPCSAHSLPVRGSNLHPLQTKQLSPHTRRSRRPCIVCHEARNPHGQSAAALSALAKPHAELRNSCAASWPPAQHPAPVATWPPESFLERQHVGRGGVVRLSAAAVRCGVHGDAAREAVGGGHAARQAERQAADMVAPGPWGCLECASLHAVVAAETGAAH